MGLMALLRKCLLNFKGKFDLHLGVQRVMATCKHGCSWGCGCEKGNKICACVRTDLNFVWLYQVPMLG